MFNANRKFKAFILTVVMYAAIILVRPEVDALAVGISLTGILGSFGFSNAMTHWGYAKNGK